MSQSRTGPDPLPQPVEPLQQLRVLRQWIVLGAILLALLLLLLAFTLINRSLQADLVRGQATLTALQVEQQQLQTPLPALQILMSTLTTTRSLADQIQGAAPPAGIDWPPLMAALDQYDPNRLVINSLTQVENRMTITGFASNDEVVVAYTQAIEKSERFGSVVLQSLRVVAAPTATPLPTTPSAVAASAQPSFLTAEATFVEFVIIVEVGS